VLLVFALAALPRAAANASESWVSQTDNAGGFALVRGGEAADIVFSAEDFKVVSISAHDLAADVERVTGVRPVVRTNAAGLLGSAVLVGTLGKSPLLDGLVASGKLDVAALRGQWESFVISTVADPLPGVSLGLVIAGSDRRGTAFGVYELAQAVGVSPWYWWADVAPEKKTNLIVTAGARPYGPPSVKYRGIFINDEDWGLQPWAAKTFEPEVGDIGPRTYAKVFELMLRLKANTVWPAMHACTKPFNHYPQNKVVADDYAIVMGSSHAEPMLRNNVGEWTAPPGEYNYVTNREGVRAYWERRIVENGHFENIYTLGMRGIHDSRMQGPKTDAERIRVLEQVFTDQRALLARHVNPRVEQVPQMFCAYKEVLDLYRRGLKVPEDVTIIWPDDNFGYIRNFATPEEQKRAGGFGVYYHLSYLGRPLAYLWLYTTPPALVWEEMSKAYAHGARTIWIANVGDLKPAEIGTEFFLQMAWDMNRWRRDNLPEFLVEWATREFGAGHATEIAAVMDQFYRLNYQRKPEHLQWWLPGQPPRPSALNDDEVRQRLDTWTQLMARADRLHGQMPPARRDSFFELVAYPVRGAALANQRYFQGEQAAFRAVADKADAQRLAAQALVADERLKDETRVFNEQIVGGKWRRMMYLEPADSQWRSMRISPWALPQFTPAPKAAANPPHASGAVPPGFSGFVESNGVVSIEAEHFTSKVDRDGVAWEVIPGLGRTGDSVAVFPTTAASLAPANLTTNAPRLEYQAWFFAAGEFPLTVYLVPTHPLVAGRGLRFAVAVDDQPPQVIVADAKDGSAEWAQGVLNATVTGTTQLKVPAIGRHTLKVFMVDAGVVLDKIVVDCGGLNPGYLGPPETFLTR